MILKAGIHRSPPPLPPPVISLLTYVGAMSMTGLMKTTGFIHHREMDGFFSVYGVFWGI